MEQISRYEYDKFIDYVWAFYGEHDDTLYPIKGLTKGMIKGATRLYLQICSSPSNHYTWGDGDSVDREHVRDILLQSL